MCTCVMYLRLSSRYVKHRVMYKISVGAGMRKMMPEMIDWNSKVVKTPLEIRVKELLLY